jgi:hypothetical protein
MKNTSLIIPLMTGGCIALIPLNNLTDELITVAIAFLILNIASYLINHHKPAK